ncbi:phosphatidate cytidylyltransferase [Rubrivirga sp.]|uniref:phosphatidate cytidylyltransferase n=1 Tax=Rubrivirga sp. TaxID=1885344 RepID=UPI003B518B4A
MSNFAQRVLTGLVGAALVVGAVWVGGWVFAVLIAGVAGAAQFELYRLVKAGGADPLVPLGLGLGAVATLWPLVPGAGLALGAGLVAVLVGVLYLRRATPLADAAGTAFGILYPCLLASSLLVLRFADAPTWSDPDRFWITTAVLFSVWGADSFAYLAGRAFGRTPLFERVSPKKTWEGAAGGALGAFALVAVFKLTVLGQAISWLDVAVIALASGVLGPFGDLAESLFKRSVGVKDSATWLPGHGGLLDRIDATLVAVPVIVIYLELAHGLL